MARPFSIESGWLVVDVDIAAPCGRNTVAAFRGYGVTRCRVVNRSNVTAVGAGFLEGCSDLTAVDLTSLSEVTTVGSWFLRCCSSLTAVDLAPLSNVATVGDAFLSQCRSLTAVDLTS